MRRLIWLPLVLVIVACESDNGGGGTAPTTTNYTVENAFPSLAFGSPVDLQSPRDGTNRLFVVEQSGRIRLFDNSSGAPQSKVFLDIRTRVNSAGDEEGLLGLAFHPQFDSNRYFFVYYTFLDQGDRKSKVARFRADAARPDTVEAGSETEVLVIDQPRSNHNGGGLEFDTDGSLYIGVGDGGSGNDPDNHGQRRETLLGNILRIDIDSLPYSIPPDNPYFGNASGYREEIYAYGFRNPWRVSYDAVSDRLWVGDVGQNAWEEIDVVENGGNYGWKIMEAHVCRPPTSGCDMTGLILPVWRYEHPNGAGRSVTGGYVYRGTTLPSLAGAYIYADYVTGEVWALRYNGATASNELVVDTSLQITSFGVDANDDLFMCASDNRVYKLQEASGE